MESKSNPIDQTCECGYGMYLQKPNTESSSSDWQLGCRNPTCSITTIMNVSSLLYTERSGEACTTDAHFGHSDILPLTRITQDKQLYNCQECGHNFAKFVKDGHNIKYICEKCKT